MTQQSFVSFTSTNWLHDILEFMLFPHGPFFVAGTYSSLLHGSTLNKIWCLSNIPAQLATIFLSWEKQLTCDSYGSVSSRDALGYNENIQFGGLFLLHSSANRQLANIWDQWATYASDSSPCHLLLPHGSIPSESCKSCYLPYFVLCLTKMLMDGYENCFADTGGAGLEAYPAAQ